MFTQVLRKMEQLFDVKEYGAWRKESLLHYALKTKGAIQTMSDLKIIKQIGQDLNVKLEELDKIDFLSKCYTLNQKGQVTGLSLWDCEIKNLNHIITQLKDLTKLTELYLGENQLSDITLLEDLTKLTVLYLGENQLSDITPLENLTELTNLNLSENQLSDITPLEDLTKLTVLYLWNNQLSDITPLEDLTKLTKLDLSANQLSDISSLKDLTKLKILDLQKNPIEELPPWITDFDMEIQWEERGGDYGYITFYNNPLKTPPVEIVKQGKGAVRDYFKSLEREKGVTLKEVKILLVGQGISGKTSLLKHLQGLEFDKNESQTHGINVISIPAREIKGLEKISELEDCTLHFWDFGGQEIMHASHQFFMSQRSLYMLVLDSRTDDKKYHWLKHIQKFGGSSPVIVVMNKIDENPGYNIQQKYINDSFPQIANRFHRISCKTKDGIPELVKCLAKTIPQTSLFGTEISRSWMNIKNKLIEETKAYRYINCDRFVEICENYNVHDQSSRLTLLQFLHDLGIVLYFKQLDFANIYVLDPHWVTIGVYKIINSGMTKDGILKEDDLDYILNKEKIKKDEYDPAKYKNITYNPEEQRYIINIMEQFELCFKIDRQNNNYIIPDLLAKELTHEPELNRGTLLRFVMKYDYLPSQIISRLMLRLKNDIVKDQQWKYGMVLNNDEFKCQAKIKSDDQKKTIDITVQGEPLSKQRYFSAIRFNISDINKDFENLVVEELIPLPGHPDFLVEYRELLGYEQEGRDEYFVGKFGKAFSVSKMLDSIQSKEEREKLIPNIFELESKKKNFTISERKEILKINSDDYFHLNKNLSINKIYSKAYRLENENKFPESLSQYEKVVNINENYLKAWQGIERINNTFGDSENRDLALKKIRIITDIIDFETNIEKTIKLQKFELNNLDFFSNLKWTFCPQFNILLGKNGYGKSYLLRFLLSLLQKDDISSDFFINSKEDSFAILNLKRNESVKVIHRIKTKFKEHIGKVPILAIPDLRFIDKSKSSIALSDIEEERGDLREYGAYHFLFEKSYEALVQSFLYELCIMHLEQNHSFDIPIFHLLHSVIEKLVNKEFKFCKIRSLGMTKFEIIIKSEGDTLKPIPIQKASQGTLSVLSIFGLIYFYLTSVFPETSGKKLLKKPAIVFIDELDAHLHPSWQRKIVGLLREHFPNIQFIVTAHSPLIVAGCLEKEVAVLRNSEHGYVVEQFPNDFIGFEAKDLYQIIFETEEKDENFLKYLTQIPFRDEIKNEIIELEELKLKNKLTDNQREKLKNLNYELSYIDNSIQKVKERNQKPSLLIENRKLKAELNKIRDDRS